MQASLQESATQILHVLICICNVFTNAVYTLRGLISRGLCGLPAQCVVFYLFLKNAGGWMFFQYFFYACAFLTENTSVWRQTWQWKPLSISCSYNGATVVKPSTYKVWQAVDHSVVNSMLYQIIKSACKLLGVFWGGEFQLSSEKEKKKNSPLEKQLKWNSQI